MISKQDQFLPSHLRHPHPPHVRMNQFWTSSSTWTPSLESKVFYLVWQHYFITTSLNSLSVRKLLDLYCPYFACWALLGLTGLYWALLGALLHLLNWLTNWLTNGHLDLLVCFRTQKYSTNEMLCPRWCYSAHNSSTKIPLHCLGRSWVWEMAVRSVGTYKQMLTHFERGPDLVIFYTFKK